MTTGKNTKGNTKRGDSQANAHNPGLMALESRVLFSAGALAPDVPEAPIDNAAAIEASIAPGESHAVINPDSMRPAANNFRGCIPINRCFSPQDATWDQATGETVGSNTNSLFNIFNELNLAGDEPRDIAASVRVVNPDSMKPAGNPEGSNPTPHPMPVPGLSDYLSKRRLEHGPGPHDSTLGSTGVINPDSMRPVDNPEGSNPTPHPMPVPGLSDYLSKRRAGW